MTAYKAARKGKTVDLKTKPVTVDSFEITSYSEVNIKNKNEDSHRVVDVNFEVVCSKGTYIRALARDLGKVLKVGGTLMALRRIKSGEFKVENAWNLSELLDRVKSYAPSIKNE